MTNAEQYDILRDNLGYNPKLFVEPNPDTEQEIYEKAYKEGYDKGYSDGKFIGENKWIPVSEKLPEESLDSVIGWDTYRERCVFIQYIGGYFHIMGSTESFNIIAWRPLPKPYKAGE